MTGMYDDPQAMHLVDKSRLTKRIDFIKSDFTEEPELDSDYRLGFINGLISAGRLLFGDDYCEFYEPNEEATDEKSNECPGCCCQCECEATPRETFVDRLVAEKEETEDKCLKLYAFILSDEFRLTSDDYQEYCREQLETMEHLLFLLSKRLELVIED